MKLIFQRVITLKGNDNKQLEHVLNFKLKRTTDSMLRALNVIISKEVEDSESSRVFRIGKEFRFEPIISGSPFILKNRLILDLSDYEDGRYLVEIIADDWEVAHFEKSVLCKIKRD